LPVPEPNDAEFQSSPIGTTRDALEDAHVSDSTEPKLTSARRDEKTDEKKPVPEVEIERPREESEEERGVAIRSRPPIFYFWPTLTAALWFMAISGLRDKPLPPDRAPLAAGQPADGVVAAPGQGDVAGTSAPAGPRTDVLRFLPRLPWGISLALVALVTLLMVTYLAAHLIFNMSNVRLVDALDRAFSRNLFLWFNAMDVFFWVLVAFVVLSPGYGLLAFLAFHAFGLMTDHKMFSHPHLLRRRFFWVVGAILFAMALTILEGPRGPEVDYQFDQSPVISAVFFGLLAFNLFVLAFDFNGASLVALVTSIAGLAAIIALLNTFYPAVGSYFHSLAQASYGLRLNSNFYQFYAYVLSLLMVFSGLIAKSDFWQITPLAIVHHQGLLVQRSRHFGALANFNYHVEFPDFFESMLGGWAGDFILSLPREERPELVKDVWYARYYNRQIRDLLEQVDLTPQKT
jgi:hypothetical protein